MGIAGRILQTILICILLSHNCLIWGLNLITPETDDYIKLVIQQWNLTGLAIAIVRQNPDSSAGGWDQEFRSYGKAKADGTLVTAETLFPIASNSKLITALAAGLLISNETLKKEKKIDLSWSTKARDVFGDAWGLMDKEASHGTSIQDMLSHRTGLPRHDGSHLKREGGLVDKIKTLRYLRPSAEFREVYQYTNLLYDSVGYLPKVFVNDSLSSYVERHLFEPLNMSTSTYSIATAEDGFLADGFQLSGQDLKRGLDGVKKAIVPLFHRPGEEDGVAGSGGVIASARDLATWISMLLALGRHPHQDGQIIPAEVVKHAATGVSTIPANVFNNFPEMSAPVYGAGQQIFSYRGHEIVEHGGNVLGFSSEITRLPNDNLGIVLLNNDWVSNFALGAIKWRLVDELVVRTALPDSPFIDWISRYKAVEEIAEGEKKSHTPRPNHPALPTLAFSDLQKRSYSHPTYGTLRPFIKVSAASDCQKIIKSLPVQRILDISDPSIPTLIIPLKSAFTTHIRLTHFSGDVFNATAIWTNAATRLEEGLGSVDENGQWTDDGDVVIPIQDYIVEWVAQGGEEGLAFKGGIWGSGAGIGAPLGSGKEAAEVWFSRTKVSRSD